MIDILFFTTVILELVYFVLFILTIKLPGFRFWPPPKARSWQFFTAWLVAALVTVNFLFLGLLNFDSFCLPHLMKRLPLALVFLIPGSIIGSWSFANFGLKSTIGLGDELITGGPYKYTRNPQYIGDMVNIVDYRVVRNNPQYTGSVYRRTVVGRKIWG